MRTRTSLIWLLLPTLAVVTVACAAIASVAAAGREDTVRLTAAGRRFDLLLDAHTAVELEATDLAVLDALAQVPPEIESLVADASPDPWSRARPELVDELFEEEARAAQLLQDLQGFGSVPTFVETSLRPLPERFRRMIAAEREAAVPVQGYVDALRWLDAESTTAQERADESARQLRAYTQAKPYWQTSKFALLATVLVALAVACSGIAIWRVSGATRRAVREAARGDRLRRLADAGRHLSTGAEPDRIAATIVGETCTLLDPEMCVLALVVDGRLVPAAARGVPSAAAVSLCDGASGRAAESGTLVRAVVPHEPLLGATDGPVSLVAVPLTVDARVIAVLVVARRGAAMLDDDDESLLALVASMSAGALALAARVGSSLALAWDDPLTGLGNRRRLDRDLAVVDPGAPTAFLMIDVDRFKEFNDAFGHPEGDELLRRVGAAISASLRAGDVAYRFGGEEFSVLLPGTDSTTAAGVAERIRAAVAAVTPPPGTRPVTVSVGVSATGPAVGLGGLVDHADRALYSAKRSGRDRTVVGAPRADAGGG